MVKLKRIFGENGKATLLAVAAIALTAAVMPTMAMADDAVGFGMMIESLTNIVNKLLLPIGVLIAAWKIIYIVLVVGLLGIDPLEMMEAGEDNTKNIGDLSSYNIMRMVQSQLKGFAYGLLWVGGVWILFQIIVSVVAMFANAVSANFS